MTWEFNIQPLALNMFRHESLQHPESHILYTTIPYHDMLVPHILDDVLTTHIDDT